MQQETTITEVSKEAYAIIRYLNSTQPKNTLHWTYTKITYKLPIVAEVFFGQHRNSSAAGIFHEVFSKHTQTGEKPHLQYASVFVKQHKKQIQLQQEVKWIKYLPTELISEQLPKRMMPPILL